MLCQCLFERCNQLQFDKNGSIIVAKFGKLTLECFFKAKWGIVGCVCVSIMDCGEGNYAKLKQASLNSLKPSFLKPTSQIK